MSLFYDTSEPFEDVCSECGEEKLVWFVTDEMKLCQECADMLGYTQCAHCGEFYPSDLVEFTVLPDDSEVCEYCMEDYPWDDD